MNENLNRVLHTLIDAIADGSIHSNTADYHAMIEQLLPEQSNQHDPSN